MGTVEFINFQAILQFSPQDRSRFALGNIEPITFGEHPEVVMNCHLTATLKSLRQSIVVIGCGNPLHCDDGVGQQIVQIVTRWGVPNVEAIAVPQLTPALVSDLEGIDLVIFVDAHASDTTDVQVSPLVSAHVRSAIPEGCTPAELLTLAQDHYGECPQAWWVTVPGQNFELGKTFSTVAKQGMTEALQQIDDLIQSVRPKSYLTP